jgi:hypothetical protein
MLTRLLAWALRRRFRWLSLNSYLIEVLIREPSLLLTNNQGSSLSLM